MTAAPAPFEPELELELRFAVGLCFGVPVCFEFELELDERDRDLELDPELRFDALAPPLDLPLPLRAVAGFDCDEAFADRLEPLFELAEEPLDDPLLDRLRGLLCAGLLFAMLIPLLGRGNASQAPCTR